MTPCSAMLAVSVAMAASSIRLRGWRGLNRIRAVGISICPGCAALRCGISDARPRPRLAGRSGLTVTTPPTPGLHRRVRPAVRGRGMEVAQRPPVLVASDAGTPRPRRGRRSRRRSRADRSRSVARGSALPTDGRSAGSRCRRPTARGVDAPRRRHRPIGWSDCRTSSGGHPRARGRDSGCRE